MANGDAFEDAVRLAFENPGLDIGCHLVLVQGTSLLTGRPLPATPLQLLRTLAAGQFDVYAELRTQIEKIRDAGITLTHLDSHKHTHIVPSVFRAVIKLAQEFDIPYVRLPLDHTTRLAGAACQFADRYYRRFAARTRVQMPDHFLGFRLTGYLTEETFGVALRKLQAGTTEFMCHPGILGDELKAARTRLKEARVRELEALTSPRIRELMAAESIHLVTFCRKRSPAARE